MELSKADYIFKEDPRFPVLLKEIQDCPLGLYYKGIFCKEKFDRTLAVVGTRRSTRYSKDVVRLLLPELILNGFTIVSGFMYGVDFEAHLFCIASNGYTVAVLPYGIDFEPPNHMRDLYDEIIINGGLVISEYPDKHPPDKWTFVARNRIVAGLSLGVLVVEAASKSGSFITASVAREYSRPVFSVPGPINSPASEGTNNMLKAIYSTNEVSKANTPLCVTTSKDILGALGFFTGSRALDLQLTNLFKVENDIGLLDKRLLELVRKNSGCDFDDLLSLIGKDSSDLIYRLTLLQISGLLEEEGGRYYVV